MTPMASNNERGFAWPRQYPVKCWAERHVVSDSPWAFPKKHLFLPPARKLRREDEGSTAGTSSTTDRHHTAAPGVVGLVSALARADHPENSNGPGGWEAKLCRFRQTAGEPHGCAGGRGQLILAWHVVLYALR